VREIIATNRGRLVGKTRLQKTAYFLESFGLGYGFDFKYHYYGPYSEDLAIAAGDASALDLIATTADASVVGNPYTIFEAKMPSKYDNSEMMEKRQRLLNHLQKYDATSLNSPRPPTSWRRMAIKAIHGWRLADASLSRLPQNVSRKRSSYWPN
jgi:hypothetical protein